jgi:hypothetical protein
MQRLAKQRSRSAVEMTGRMGKGGKPKTGFPPFSTAPLEIAVAIPTFPPAPATVALSIRTETERSSPLPITFLEFRLILR